LGNQIQNPSKIEPSGQHGRGFYDFGGFRFFVGSFRKRYVRAPILYDFKVEDLGRKIIPDSFHFASLCWMEDELQQANIRINIRNVQLRLIAASEQKITCALSNIQQQRS
jgi:hypothetical protein